MIDDGVITAETSSGIWKVLCCVEDNNTSMKYLNEFYDTEKSCFLSHLKFSYDPYKRDLFYSHFGMITDKNVDFAIDLLHSRNGKISNGGIDDDYINIVKSTYKQGYSFLDSNDKHALLAVISKLGDTDKALFKNMGSILIQFPKPFLELSQMLRFHLLSNENF